MQITSNSKTETNKVDVEFNISAEEFEAALSSAYQKRRKSINVPGFRKGKAPRKIIETTYGESVFYEDAVTELYQRNAPLVVDELGLEIVDSPEIEVANISKLKGVDFKARFTVKPEVTLGEYKGLEVEIDCYDVTEADIDKAIEKVRQDFARLVDASDREVVSGDIIKFDFTGFCDGVVFEGGSATDFELEIGSGNFIPGFEDQIIGKKVGEDFDVTVTFPEDYPAENLKGKEAVFKCNIHGIQGKEFAVFDDEFVKDISEFDTVAEYREDLREKLKKDFENLRMMDTERELALKIGEIMEAEIPQVMFEDRIDEIAREHAFRYRMNPRQFAERNGMTLEMLRENFRIIAENQVKFRLALEKIAELENITFTDEEVEAKYKELAEANNLTIERVKKIAPRKGLESDMRTERALEILRDSAKITEKAKD